MQKNTKTLEKEQGSTSSVDLKQLTDLQLVEIVRQTASDEAFLELKTRHEKSYYKACHRYSRVMKSLNVEFDQVLDNINLILFDAILKFNPEKSRFNTFLTNLSKYALLNMIRRQKKVSDHVNCFISSTEIDEEHTHIFEKELFQSYHPDALKDNTDFLNHLKGEIKDQKTLYILSLRYGEDKLSWQRISEISGLSVSVCQSIHNKAIKTMREQFKESGKLQAA